VALFVAKRDEYKNELTYRLLSMFSRHVVVARQRASRDAANDVIRQVSYVLSYWSFVCGEQ